MNALLFDEMKCVIRKGIEEEDGSEM